MSLKVTTSRSTTGPWRGTCGRSTASRSRSRTARSWGSPASPAAASPPSATALIRIDGRMRHVGGQVELDGVELPIADNEAMNAFRFKQISLVPQYAMSALNPTRKIGRMIREVVGSRDVRDEEIHDELERRLELVGLTHAILDMYPIELSGGMKQRLVMVLSTLLDPAVLIADEITSALDVSSQHAVAQTLVASGTVGSSEHDRGHPRCLDPVPDLGHARDHVRGQARREGVHRDADAGSPPSVHQDAVSSLPEMGRRFSEKRLAGIPGTPPSLLNPPDGCRFRDRCPLADAQCLEEPPFVEIGPATAWPAGRSPDARPGACLQGLPRGSLRRVGAVAVRDVTLEHRPGRGRLADRRVGERQDDHRQDDPAPDLDTGGRISSTAPTSPRSRVAVARALPIRPGGVPGPLQLIQPDLQGRPHLRNGQGRVTTATPPAASGRRGWRRRCRASGSTPASSSTSTPIS